MEGTSSHPRFSDAIIKGVAWMSLGATGIRIIGFLTAILLLRVFSLREYGTYQLILSVGGLFILLTFQGIDEVVTAVGARAKGAGNEAEAFSVGRGYFYFKLLIGILIWCAAFFGSNLLSRWYSADVLASLRIYSFVFLTIPFERLIGYHLSISRRFRDLSAYVFFQEAVKLASIFVTLYVFHLRITGALLSIPLAIGCSTLLFFPAIGWGYLRERLDRADVRRFWSLVKSQGIWVIGQRFSRQTERNVRPILIQFFLGVEAVALFSIAEKAYFYLSAMFPIDDVLMPSIAAETDNRMRLQRILERGIKYTVPFYAAIAVAFVAASPILLRWAFPQYLPAMPLLRIMALYIPFVGLAYILTAFYTSHLEQRRMFWLLLGRLGFFAVVLPVSVWLFGVNGVMVEYVVTLAAYNLARLAMLTHAYPELRVRWRSLLTFDSYDRAVLHRFAGKFRSLVKRSA